MTHFYPAVYGLHGEALDDGSEEYDGAGGAKDYMVGAGVDHAGCAHGQGYAEGTSQAAPGKEYGKAALTIAVGDGPHDKCADAHTCRPSDEVAEDGCQGNKEYLGHLQYIEKAESQYNIKDGIQEIVQDVPEGVIFRKIIFTLGPQLFAKAGEEHSADHGGYSSGE